MSDSMDYIINECIFRFSYRDAEKRLCAHYVVADFWENAANIAVDFCIANTVHLVSLEKVHDSAEMSSARGSIALIDKSAL